MSVQANLRARDGALSPEELERVERFETLFNTVHRWMRKRVGAKRDIPFAEAVTRYAGGRPHWAEQAEFLRQVARLRNTLVHERVRPREYLAVPAPMIVEHLERIHAELSAPPGALAEFGRKVLTLSARSTLHDALEAIAGHDFSQFPVFQRTSFRGLLTENGITRWLAHNLADGVAMLDLKCVSVLSLLSDQETTRNVAFLGAKQPAAKVRNLFAERDLLEAVLITRDGSPGRRLLGIATRWDIARRH